MRFLVEGSDNAKTSQIFASNESDFIDEFLVNFKFGHGEPEDNDAKEDDGTDTGGDGPCHVGCGLIGLENCTEPHHRSAKEHGEHHHDGLLYLANVVRCAGDERSGREVVDVGDAEAEHLFIKVSAKVARESGSDASGEEVGDKSEK